VVAVSFPALVPCPSPLLGPKGLIDALLTRPQQLEILPSQDKSGRPGFKPSVRCIGRNRPAWCNRCSGAVQQAGPASGPARLGAGQEIVPCDKARPSVHPSLPAGGSLQLVQPVRLCPPKAGHPKLDRAFWGRATRAEGPPENPAAFCRRPSQHSACPPPCGLTYPRKDLAGNTWRPTHR
jgi:hypothetical protein